MLRFCGYLPGQLPGAAASDAAESIPSFYDLYITCLSLKQLQRVPASAIKMSGAPHSDPNSTWQSHRRLTCHLETCFDASLPCSADEDQRRTPTDCSTSSAFHSPPNIKLKRMKSKQVSASRIPEPVACAVGRGSNRHFIPEFIAHPAYSWTFQHDKFYLESKFRRLSRVYSWPWNKASFRIEGTQRVVVITRSTLHAELVFRLISFQNRISVLRSLQFASFILSRPFSNGHYFRLEHESPKCISKLQGHTCSVVSVAFHPHAPVLATGSRDSTAKLWRFRSGGLAATCTATLGHSDWVSSVLFHPCGTILVTCNFDHFVRLWQLNSDCSQAECVTVLRGHSGPVLSSAFHPFLPIMATCSADHTVVLWRVMITADDSMDSMGENSLHCALTIRLPGCDRRDGLELEHDEKEDPKQDQEEEGGKGDDEEVGGEGVREQARRREEGHNDCINALAFHRDGSILATCSNDRTAMLWFSDAKVVGASAFCPRCFATLKGHTATVSSVSFHPHDLILATGSEDWSARLWSINVIGMHASCIAVFAQHLNRITSVTFCPWASNVLATGSMCRKNVATLWSLNSSCSASVCSATIPGDERSPLKSICGVLTIAFHPSAPVFITGSEDNTLTIWR